MFIGTSPHRDSIGVEAALGECVGGVDQQIDEHLGQPAIVGEDQRCGAELADQMGAMANLVAREANRGFDDAGECERDALVVLGPAERAKAVHDLAYAFRSTARVGERGAQLGANRRARRGRHGLEGLGHGLEVACDVGQRVIDLVGNPRSEGAQARHPIGDQELVAHPLALGDIAAAGDHGRCAADLDEDRRDLTAPPALIGAADPELDELAVRLWTGAGRLAEQLLGRFAIVGVNAIDEIDTAPAVGGRVDPEQSPEGLVDVDELAVAADRDQLGDEVDDGAKAFVGSGVELAGPPAQPPYAGHGNHKQTDECTDGEKPPRLPPRGQDREVELGWRAPAAGADPRSDLEAIGSRKQLGIAGFALVGHAPLALHRRQPNLVLES